MRLAIFFGITTAIVVAIVSGAVAMLKASSNQWERNEQAFRAACAEVKGVAVWNNKYWECLK